jgi:hypothetical protein
MIYEQRKRTSCSMILQFTSAGKSGAGGVESISQDVDTRRVEPNDEGLGCQNRRAVTTAKF